MALTAEQTTAQNFKDFYDRIRPLLNAQHYHIDRSGQELKSAQYALAESVAIGTGTNISVAVGARLPFVKQSGDFIDGPVTGSFIVPAGMRIEVTLFGTVTDGASNNSGVYLYNETDGVYLDSVNNRQMPGAYFYGGQASLYGMSQSCVVQWTNNTGKDITVSMRNAANGTVLSLRVHATGMTVKEIGRIVDPIEYVSNGQDSLEETPVGNIISYMGNNAPKHYLKCDGSEYPIGSFPELEAHFITEFGSVNYFGGDGTTKFAVPDLRGEFLRGTGANSHTNQGSGANVGTHQDATEVPRVYLEQNSTGVQLGAGSPTKTIDVRKADHIFMEANGYNNTGKLPNGGGYTIEAYSAYATRPTNTSVQYCIKFESTYHVIVPSHTYKVNASFDIEWSAAQNSYMLKDLTAVKGDSSLVSNNHFVAPVDGWYAVSFNSGQVAIASSSMATIQYIEVNDASSWATNAMASNPNNRYYGIDANRTLYLSKGDTVRLRLWTDGKQFPEIPGGRNANFCLLTSDYKDNIIGSGEVYSEEEQEIGVWIDGKKLYQKSVSITFPNKTVQNIEVNIANVENIVKAYGYVKQGSNIIFIPFHMDIIDQRGGIYCNIIDSTKIKLVLHSNVDATGFSGYATIQYTKTTDTAGQYQYKNSILLTRPDLWDEGVEYDFGGGLYGIRSSGTATLAANTQYDAVLVPNTAGLTANCQMIDRGGWWEANGAGGFRYLVDSDWQSGSESCIWFDPSSGQMNIKVAFKVGRAMTSKYDIWVTYRK